MDYQGKKPIKDKDTNASFSRITAVFLVNAFARSFDRHLKDFNIFTKNVKLYTQILNQKIFFSVYPMTTFEGKKNSLGKDLLISSILESHMMHMNGNRMEVHHRLAVTCRQHQPKVINQFQKIEERK